jgi:hypothetical protein
LKGNDAMPGPVAEDAVGLAPLQVAEHDQPPLQRCDLAATVAVAQITGSRQARQREQDEEWSNKHAASCSVDDATRVAAYARQTLLLADACSSSWQPHEKVASALAPAFLPAGQTVRPRAAPSASIGRSRSRLHPVATARSLPWERLTFSAR